ncbi:D-alanyl-D-alanine carboxypeptidase DacA [Paenibacillus plantiphilus]|uniref:serine-type D-Ala-D-Ala carboxypeptidase n=2 Tax=Paenibacillus plantiphilus TaxID=2905650 RepID=A0ABN8H278_9BACL|nr:D-alanyl-D-alanine carboxypeptidase DacA [Paenibacillus plantiphilus]
MKRNLRPARLLSVISAMLVVWLLTMAVGSTVALAEGKSSVTYPENSLGLTLQSAMLIDADTGQVLYQVNQDQPRPPASMTKMMTEFIVLEEIAAGRLKWDGIVTTSEAAASTPKDGSQIYLAEGDKHTVKDLYIAMAVGSANDATIALADHIGGNEQGFVDKMNETAKTLGLNSAHFTGATGLDETTLISAADMAKFAAIILKKHPEFLDYSKLPSYKFRERDDNPMINYNWMLETNKDTKALKQYAYPGVDGMKTGYIGAAGYCFTGTAERDGIRLIAVVMGAKSKGSRFLEAAKMFDYGFNNFERKTVVAPKTTLDNAKTATIKKGVSTEVPVVTATDITFLVKKGVEPKIEQTKLSLMTEDELVAPIKNGQKVGAVTYSYTDADTGKAIEKTVDLISTEEVEKGSWWRLLFRAIGDFFVGLFNGIVGLF